METNNNILVLGAGGQVGTELVLALREKYPDRKVIAGDIKQVSEEIGQQTIVDALNLKDLTILVEAKQIGEIYLLAALLSASGETYPEKAWNLNMNSLLNALNIAKDKPGFKVFFPSSISIYGPSEGKPTTVYGITKYAGEHWCAWYHKKYGVDVRSLRYPGLISHTASPGGGTTDYAVEIFHKAIETGHYNCFLHRRTKLPMMYMEDAVRATIEIMEAPAEKLSSRMGYDIAAFSFTPAELADCIRRHIPDFSIDYTPEPVKQQIAESWPAHINDGAARKDWGWEAKYTLETMVEEMLIKLMAKKEEKV